MLRESIEKVLSEYLLAKKEPFTRHPLASFIRSDFPQSLYGLIPNPEKYSVKGSPGMNTWAGCPWVAIFDIGITTSAQSGYYPVYLFKVDMQGVYLSLNQGITAIQEEFKNNRPKKAMKELASDFRNRIGYEPPRFPKSEIDLASTSTSSLAAQYEAANIYARYYDSSNLPERDELISDLRDMLILYESISPEDEEDHPSTYKEIEDRRKVRWHKSVERKPTISKKVKKIHGYTCRACGFNFENFYGEIGEEFIEAHHLIPIAQLKGQVAEVDLRNNFAVLCSNCHRMIHKFERPEDIEAVKEIIR